MCLGVFSCSCVMTECPTAHLQDLEKPEQMYRKLGAKLVVGMPFKDQACSDTLVLPEVPPASNTDKRRALARLQVRFSSLLARSFCWSWKCASGR